MLWSFLHSSFIQKYFLSIYYVPSIVLGFMILSLAVLEEVDHEKMLTIY